MTTDNNILTKTTHIGFLVDISASMVGIYRSIIEKGIDEFLQKQLLIENNIQFYGYAFNEYIYKIFPGINLKNNPNVKDEFLKINPNGLTSLYDSMLEIIKNIEDKYKPDDEVIICVMTDGEDNSSKQSSTILKEVIKNCKNKNWIIILFGTIEANITSNSKLLGLSTDCIMEIGKSEYETTNAYRSLSQGIDRVRDGIDNNITFTSIERSFSNSELFKIPNNIVYSKLPTNISPFVLPKLKRTITDCIMKIGKSEHETTKPYRSLSQDIDRVRDGIDNNITFTSIERSFSNSELFKIPNNIVYSKLPTNISPFVLPKLKRTITESII